VTQSRIASFHGGAQQLHAVDVLRLARDVLAAHVHHAFHAITRGDGGGGDSMLAGAGLGDHARLAHAPGEQRLAHGVVHLVRAGVVQVLALEVDLRASQLAGEPARMVDGAGAADVVLELPLQVGEEFRIVAEPLVGRGQLVERLAQRLGDEDAAIGAEVALAVGQRIVAPVALSGMSHLHF
jgi:hypothetical protein